MTKKDFQLIANAINSLSLPIDTKAPSTGA